MKECITGVTDRSETILPLMIIKPGILLCLLVLSVGPIDARSAQHGGAAEQHLLYQNPAVEVGVENLAQQKAATPLDPKPFPSGHSRFPHEEELVKQAYFDAFGVNVPKPAYAPSIQGGMVGYWTSTAYVNTEMVRLYVYPDGTYQARQSSVLKPSGTFRTVNIAIDYGNSNIADVYESIWVDAQNRINAAHKSFADEKGYIGPIVSFEFKNILIDSGDISDPANSSEVVEFLRSRGISDDEYDVIAVLDLDAHNPRGGSASIQNRFIYMGWFFGSETFGEIDSTMAATLANAVYGHEASHLWGWEHEWTNGYEFDRSLAWTAPLLMGWEDTDGDGIPEILDPTPYGITVPSPILVTPADHERNVPLTVPLSWTQSTNADKFHVQVSSTIEFESPEIDDRSIEETLYDAGPLEPSTVYYWRVRASADGNLGFWSETRSFFTASGDGPVVILHPYDEFTLEVGEATILDLYGVFHSQDGSPLTYAVSNSDDDVVRAMVVEVEYLELLALSEGTAEITLLADNGSGGTATSSFLVTVVTGVSTEPRHEQPGVFALAQNHPNPFSRTTNVTFDVPQQSAVAIKVYDMLGRELGVIAEGSYSAGRYQVVWDATDTPSGVYLYRLEAGSYSETRSLTIRK